MTFRVGVFEHPGKRGPQFRAYVTDFNPQWAGCCMHLVEARSGAEAKRWVIEEHQRTVQGEGVIQLLTHERRPT